MIDCPRLNGRYMLPSRDRLMFTRGVYGSPGFAEVYAVHADPSKGWVGRIDVDTPRAIWTPVRKTKELAALHLGFLISERKLETRQA